ncbi:MAG: endonuclease MutS2 [Peptococcaceae bacterium]|nr:endonuclease MutS2 [Peptococcaceae bacterium]
MDNKALKRLEFYKVKEQLASFTYSNLGRERVMALEPVTDLQVIIRRQGETSEGRELYRLEPATEFYGWQDVRTQLQKAGRGGVLEPEDLLAVADTLTSCRLVKNFFREKGEKYPILSDLSFALFALPELENSIKKTILPGGEVSDRASATLAQLRRKIAGSQLQVKEYLDKVIRSPQYQKYMQDPIVTIREGRYVVPIKIEHRSQMPGLIHDQSASGATLFIEPMGVVEKNNEIRSLVLAEKQEVYRILSGLSANIANHSEDLLIAMDTLGEFDFILAKARYSQKLSAWAPEFTEETILEIRLGRHPLLQGKVVPVNLVLGRDFDTLVITGPNTGGKTVALKTAGLLTLMAQSGLHLPAEEGTRMGVFYNVFTDIGDEQSIEESLSTFSSHLTNIVEIVERADRHSLVLLDELGAGTDPTEGAALAQSILEKLHMSGAKTIATTHYNELKSFAYTRDRVENASVEFDAITLRPTFRLLTGHPGRSNAFETAKKLGLSQELIDRAKEFLTVEQIKIEEFMQNLEKTQQEAEQSWREAHESMMEAGLLKDKYHKMQQELSQKKEAIIAKAGEEAGKLVKSAKSEAEAAVKALREKLSQEASKGREQAIQVAREQLSALQTKVNKKTVTRKPPSGKAPETLRVGEEVYLPQYNQKGFVLNPPGSDGEVQVQVGIIKISVPMKELRLVEKPRLQKDGDFAGIARTSLDKAKAISMELDLRGQYAEDALQLIDKYFDDAALAGLTRVRLIHGKGTGLLRTAVQSYLKTHHRVSSYRLGEQGEGGMGVTVVEMK